MVTPRGRGVRGPIGNRGILPATAETRRMLFRRKSFLERDFESLIERLNAPRRGFESACPVSRWAAPSGLIAEFFMPASSQPSACLTALSIVCENKFMVDWMRAACDTVRIASSGIMSTDNLRGEEMQSTHIAPSNCDGNRKQGRFAHRVGPVGCESP